MFTKSICTPGLFHPEKVTSNNFWGNVFDVFSYWSPTFFQMGAIFKSFFIKWTELRKRQGREIPDSGSLLIFLTVHGAKCRSRIDLIK